MQSNRILIVGAGIGLWACFIYRQPDRSDLKIKG